MKKILLLFFVGLFLVGFSQKEEKQTDWQKSKLKGKVKSAIWSKYNADNKFGEFKKVSLKRRKTFKFNISGNKIEEAKYRSNGDLKTKKTFKYDESGNKIEQAVYKSDGSLSCLLYTSPSPRDS